MSASIVTGDDRTITATLTIDGSIAIAGAALAAASTVKACLIDKTSRLAVTPVYTISAGSISTVNATVAVAIPSVDTKALDASASLAMEITITNGSGQRLTWTDIGPITVKKGVIP